MSKRMYVGNMNFKTTEENLKTLFANYGDVASVNLIKDKESGKSRGFAFVEMSDDNQALSAINALNGYEFDGRKLKVNEAFDKNTDGGGGNGGPRNRDRGRMNFNRRRER